MVIAHVMGLHERFLTKNCPVGQNWLNSSGGGLLVFISPRMPFFEYEHNDSSIRLSHVWQNALLS